MKTAHIRAQLETVIASYASQKLVGLALQNSTFTPKVDVPHIESTLLPATTVGATRCSNDYKGLFHINVFTPANDNAYKAEQMAEEIASLFKRGSNFGGVHIPQPPSIGVGRNEGVWYQTPVRITYQLID